MRRHFDLHAHWEAKGDYSLLVLTYCNREQKWITVWEIDVSGKPYTTEELAHRRAYAADEADRWATEHHYSHIIWD